MVFICVYGGDLIDFEWIQMIIGEDWKEVYGQKFYEIIDVIEVFMEILDDLYMQCLFYSYYKKCYVCKFFGVCYLNCFVVFCLVGFFGFIFDNEICFVGKDYLMFNYVVY